MTHTRKLDAKAKTFVNNSVTCMEKQLHNFLKTSRKAQQTCVNKLEANGSPAFDILEFDPKFQGLFKCFEVVCTAKPRGGSGNNRKQNLHAVSIIFVYHTSHSLM